MNPSTLTWVSWREAPAVVLATRHLRRTVAVAVIVGSVFFGMNQLGLVLSGQATALTWLKVGLTYLTPLCVSSFGVLSATRRRIPVG